MGVHFGVSYLAVLPDSAEKSVLGIADRYPSAFNENTYEPVIDDKYLALGPVSVFTSEKEAKNAVKRHILLATRSEVLAYACQIEDAQMDIAEYKFELKALDKRKLGDAMFQEQTEYYQKKIDSAKRTIDLVKTRLAEIKKLRNKKIEVTFPGEL